MKRSELEKLSISELADKYNELTFDKPVQKFATKDVAVERTLRAARIRRLCTYNKKGSDVAKPPREGSNREKAYLLMKRPEGATVQEIMEATGWDFEKARGGVRCVWSVCGYGLNTDEKGRIRIDD